MTNEIFEVTHEESAVFLALLGGAVFVLRDPQILFDEICLRKQPWAEIYRLNTLQEANTLAFQRYGAWFYRTEKPSGERPMALPGAGEFALAPASLLEETVPASFGFMSQQLVETTVYSVSAQHDFGGVWALHALNGYGTQADASGLVNLLMETSLIYPCAQWYAKPEEALYWARYQYVQRFYMRYDGQTTYPIMPQDVMNVNVFFHDEHFAEREKQRQDNRILNELRSLGLLV